MRHWCVCLLWVSGCLTGAVADDHSPAADEGLDVLRAYLDGLGTVTADFRQQIVDRDLEPIDDSSGQVILKKPGRFRWDYREPYERVISADGERVWLYEADLDQVTIRRLDAGLGETPAALLTGAADVLDHFDYRGSEVDDGIRWLRLEPRAAESDFSGVELGFAGQELQRIFLTDRLGQRTRILLSNVDTTAAVEDDFFVFQVPDGVDVIEADDL
ncbi:MAG: outer membrane lipoprotein chaperone LolA [Gammaproteobacteria bacterium]